MCSSQTKKSRGLRMPRNQDLWVEEITRGAVGVVDLAIMVALPCRVLIPGGTKTLWVDGPWSSGRVIYMDHQDVWRLVLAQAFPSSH